MRITLALRRAYKFQLAKQFFCRQVLQDFGPFPVIGCDSESLCWLFQDGSGLRAGEGASAEGLGAFPRFLLVERKLIHKSTHHPLPQKSGNNLLLAHNLSLLCACICNRIKFMHNLQSVANTNLQF
jgi:hypothetical protein